MSALKVHHEVSRNWEKGSSIHMQWVSDESGTYAYRFVTKRNQKEEVGIVPSQTILEELIHMARKSVATVVEIPLEVDQGRAHKTKPSTLSSASTAFAKVYCWPLEEPVF